jgi:Autotransporter beta-domain
MKIQAPLSFIAKAMLLIGAVWLSNQAQAAPCDSSANPIIIASNCSDLVVSNTKSAITLNPGITINGDHGLLIQTVNGNIGTVTVNTGSQIIGTVYSGIDNEGTITGLNNTSLIQGIGNGISNFNTIGTINNNGLAVISGNDQGITNFAGASIASLMNSGTISAANNYGVYNLGTINGITNNLGGTIHGRNIGIFNSAATIATLTNSGSLTGQSAISNAASSSIGLINNTSSGGISGTAGYGILNGGTIASITNAGTISAAGGLYEGIVNNGTITTITNYGSGAITGSSGGPGIINNGTLTTLNVGGSGTLKYNGAMPTYLNTIINGGTYGKLSLIGNSNTGQSTFGIYGGGVSGVAASTLNRGTYSTVLSGVATGNIIGATKGNYNGFTWSLSETDTINGIWNLLVTGASTADTQQSLVNTASALQNTFTLQNSVLANSFSYDCNVFGANDVCISAGGRNTQVSAANGLNNTSALLIAAYRVMPFVRVGAYADQNLSVNNTGSTVNLGNNTPLVGLFGAWNERLDGTGTEVKVSAAYGQKNTTVTRQVVGTSEAGSGSSQLNSQGAQVTAKYGFGIVENVIVSPYVGMRYTQNNMNGYSEQATSSVTAPLTYSALNTNATTALAGVGASYRFIPQATAFASAGVESDTNTNNGTYSATGVAGLTPINFNANPVRTRPTATLGAYYDIEKNQRLGITGIYRQEPYQAVQTTTVLATYTVGL